MYYFDHAASTPIHPEVLTFLCESLKNDFANPSAAHQLGVKLQQKIILAQNYFVQILGGNKKDHFYFMSSATEANNTIISGVSLLQNQKILCSMSDHASLVAPVLNLKQDQVLFFKHCANGETNGEIDEEDFLGRKDLDNVGLVLLSFVNNQSGNIQKVNWIAEKLKEINPNVHVHVDLVQGFTKLAYQLSNSIDSVSVAAHKIGGPKGIAGLFLREKHRVKPLLMGGGQQGNFRSSTEAYPLIGSFQLAAELMLKKQSEHFEFAMKLKSKIIDHLKSCDSRFLFPFPVDVTSPYILCLIVPGIPSDVLLRHLEISGIICSSSSACSSKIKGFSPTLMALNIPEKWHKNVLRISMSPMTTMEDGEELCKGFTKVWNDLKYLIK